MTAQVIHGDCLEVMRGFPDNYFDCCLTDPPYGTTALHFDQTPIDLPAWWAEVHRVTKETGVIVCFAADLFTVDLIQSNRKHYRYRLVWEKTMPTGFLDANRRPLRAHEDVLIFARRFKDSTYNPQKRQGFEPYRVESRRDQKHYGGMADEARGCASSGERHPITVLKFGQGSNFAGKDHPTQKPLDLMQWLVATYTNPGDRVLDPFAGSGSTGAACVALGREFVGIELDPAYHAIAERRVRNAQPALLGAL